jgi:hypothetical protein
MVVTPPPLPPGCSIAWYLSAYSCIVNPRRVSTSLAASSSVEEELSGTFQRFPFRTSEPFEELVEVVRESSSNGSYRSRCTARGWYCTKSSSFTSQASTSLQLLVHRLIAHLVLISESSSVSSRTISDSSASLPFRLLRRWQSDWQVLTSHSRMRLSLDAATEPRIIISRRKQAESLPHLVNEHDWEKATSIFSVVSRRPL